MSGNAFYPRYRCSKFYVIILITKFNGNIKKTTFIQIAWVKEFVKSPILFVWIRATNILELQIFTSLTVIYILAIFVFLHGPELIEQQHVDSNNGY